MTLLQRALTDPRGFGDQKVAMEPDDAGGHRRLCQRGCPDGPVHPGDGGPQRQIWRETPPRSPGRRWTSARPKSPSSMTRTGEEHYNLISALHKSMRNSDPDAAVYWLARMLEAGEDPLYVARRVTRFASEDVGLADPRALEVAVAAYQACHFHRYAGVHCPPDPGRGLPVPGAQVQCPLHRPMRAPRKTP